MNAALRNSNVTNAATVDLIAKLVMSDTPLAVQMLSRLDNVSEVIAALSKRIGALEALYFAEGTPIWMKREINDVFDQEGYLILT